jgi:hypothetical protein
MKVYPISLIKFAVEPGGQTAQLPAVQANIDENVGLRAWVPVKEERKGPIAIVGFGPSLRRTFAQLREYPVIWTVSGAHDFLVRRGITPTYHTDVDWRPHKANFIKTPLAGVQYRMANTVHPKYIAKLKDFSLELFQPVGNDTAEWLTLDTDYPEVQMPGDVAMTAVEMAVMEGWTDVHTFGVDGSHDFDGTMLEPEHAHRATSHAGTHDGVKAPVGYVIDMQFKLHQTSQNLVKACDAFCKMVDKFGPNVSVTVVSDGLLPAWIEMFENRRAMAAGVKGESNG